MCWLHVYPPLTFESFPLADNATVTGSKLYLHFTFLDKGKPWTREGRTVTAGGRNGGIEQNKAFNGTNSDNYYYTPDEFFGKEGEKSEVGYFVSIFNPRMIFYIKG